MILVERYDCQNNPKGRQIVALFGVGLIGRSILTAISRMGPCKVKELSFTWEAEHRHPTEFEAIRLNIITRRDEDRTFPVSQIDTVWAAGHSGFGSSEEQIAPEVRAFEKVLSFSLQLLSSPTNIRHSFHLISSAGGLFEGQKNVNRASLPRPLRPYGHAKIQHERLLSGAPALMQKIIYRPSSVYGFSGKGFRLGLVNALIQNSFRHRTSNIFGDLLTIRDYVLVSDIGKFVATTLCDSHASSNTFTLASGKPTTIFEMLHRMERILGRKLLYRFDRLRTNTIDISFSQSVLPKFWHPTDLETGLRQTARHLVESLLGLN